MTQDWLLLFWITVPAMGKPTLVSLYCVHSQAGRKICSQERSASWQPFQIQGCILLAAGVPAQGNSLCRMSLAQPQHPQAEHLWGGKLAPLGLRGPSGLAPIPTPEQGDKGCSGLLPKCLSSHTMESQGTLPAPKVPLMHQRSTFLLSLPNF